ncbi:MAG TPA: addiction module protein [Pirellulaceae bacterium]|jgi:putative addiction module component (TIGR02574 family)
MNVAISVETLTEAVLALPRKDKVTLLTLLEDSLADDDSTAADAYDAEIKRRIESTDRGDATLISHEEVKRRLGPKYGKKAD